MFTAAKERKRLVAGIRHVSANIRKVFEKPETAKGKAGGFAMKEEIGCTEKRHEQLSEGSAKNHNCFAEPREKEMAAFVDDQINVIEEEKTAAVEGGVNKEERIETEPADPCDTGNRLPSAECVFEKGHFAKRSKRDSVGKGVRRKVFRYKKTRCRAPDRVPDRAGAVGMNSAQRYKSRRKKQPIRERRGGYLSITVSAS